jgi:fructose/tagatose bisphosphate aldolase
MYTSIDELQQAVTGVLRLDGNTLRVTGEQTLREKIIDDLVFTAMFAADQAVKAKARSLIRQLAEALGIRSSSLHHYYLAIGKGEVPTTSTVPAINIRTLTYDTARVLFKLKRELSIGPLIVEIARSEMGYTYQRPDDYAVAVLAAAIKEGYSGPVFLQGDHAQVNARRYREDPAAETLQMKRLIQETIDADFHNIDIDASTLVDLSKGTLDEQQVENYRVTAAFTEYIRSLETKGTISVGAEIGHIGGKNSTPEELEAFLEGYNKALGNSVPGISKISVQTGTSHGGIPLPDGSIADVQLDFSVLDNTGRVAREKYHIGGVVQHGASTLPNELFDQFPKHKTLEIHLATGFQNIIYDTMPDALRQDMYQWVENNRQEEWEAGLNREQFLYTTRKKAFGPFRQRLWELSEQEKQPIKEHLEQQFRFLFEKLNVVNTREAVEKYV